MLASVAVSTLVGYLLTKLNGFTGWNSGGTSAMACFFALHFIFKKFLWKNVWIRRWLLVPDLNGEWECQGMATTRDGDAAQTA